jgi:hypothetical protein
MIYMKKLCLNIILFFSWFSIGFTDINGINYLDCNVKDHDPDYLQPKNIVFKIEYDTSQNSGKTYFYKLDNIKHSGSENFPMGFLFVTSKIYHIYPMDANTEAAGRAFDFFFHLDEMKLYMNMYIKGEFAKRFTSDCKFVKN